MQKILLFEINEVPFRVIDYYCDMRPTSTLARILSRSRQYETVTEDSLALDPWISWPTMHRGVPDNKHQILHLGQVLDEVDAQYPPIWRLLKQAGVSVGVFGSLQERGFFQLFVQFDHFAPDTKVTLHGEEIAAESLGLGMMAHEDGVNCTAKHVPEGSMIVYSSGTHSGDEAGRQRVSTLEFVPSVLEHFNVRAPEYLQRDVKVHFGPVADIASIERSQPVLIGVKRNG